MRLRHQAKNLEPGGTPPPWGSRMPVKVRLDPLSAEPEHTRPDPCTDQRSRPWYVPAQRHSETVLTADWPIYIFAFSSHVNSSSTLYFNSCVCWLEIYVQITRATIDTIFYITLNFAGHVWSKLIVKHLMHSYT